MPETTTVERLRRNLFPVDVSIDGAVVVRARAVLTERRVVVIDKAGNVAHSAHLIGPAPDENRRERLDGRMSVATTLGLVWLNPSSCGCGSKARAASIGGVDW